MLTVAGLSKAFGGRVLFDDVSLTLLSGERVGLVGPNGAGKSTLLKIILGQETPDAGEVTFIRGTRFGYLPQESEPAGNEAVLDISVPHDHEHDGQFVAKAKQILAHLGFKQSDFMRPARELSGGWVMRAHLARLLVQEPDVLMLDEPTNHLDLETLLWFQDYLRHYPGAILLISHDREFLNRLCTHVAELRSSRVLRYTGNYDEYLEQRAATEATMIATAKAQQREIDRMQLFVDRFRAKNTKATQAQSKLKQIERLKEDMVETPDGPGPTVGFRFPQPQRSGHRVITLKHVRFGYSESASAAVPAAALPNTRDAGNLPAPPASANTAAETAALRTNTKLIYENLHFEAERGQRIVLVGPNGAGKSTLLKLLADVLKPQAGERKLGHNAKSGYFAQHRAQMLNPRHTVLQEALDTPQRVTEQFVRTVLGSFLFRGDDVFKPVSVLSGGEKSRLALVKLLLDPPNLLLMDEPTTHLDLASVDALIEALEPYEGTLIFISHDVHFIRALANHVVRVENGRLRHFTGGYQYYLDKTAQSARAALTSSSGSGGAGTASSQRSGHGVTPPSDATWQVDRKVQKRIEAELRQARSRKKREIQQRIGALEKEIAELETREKELTVELESPETYTAGGRAVEVNRQLMEIHNQLAGANAEWEKAGAELARVEAETDAT
ncbi:MAG TPA: ABC-F family ATP-binding cassette domain-containing protein [Candidatus Acidoferrales bacterium]|nr:ABC-F family ATP-binding cassette domain-containing protein [Candidatus Acidoferrales bacterium]